ncbi:MAG: PmoA family protein [Oscillospiraceae bacterium]|nr:PmoA family protein [Oscillospiraceae bacterium]
MKLKINSGNHELISAPVFFDMKNIQGDLSDVFLIDTNDKNRIIPASPSYELHKKYVFIVDYMPKNTTVEYEIINYGNNSNTDSKKFKPVELVSHANIHDIIFDGECIASYYCKTDIPKPYLGPFKAANGDNITRFNYAGKEHPHHRSLWFSHGEINGSDTWNEPENHGYILNNSIKNIYGGLAYKAFTAVNTWTHHNKTPIADDETQIIVYTPACFTKIIDVSLTLKANYGDVILGQTKEAGPIAVRMAENLTVDNGGTIVNSYGAVNEKEIWMKRACFNDYYGKVSDGKIYGIAIFDNPSNDGYPSYWHTRDYGLMAVNNFYIGGERTIKNGESATYKYRIVVHENDTETAKINTLFNNYINQPAVEIYE